MAPAPPLKSTSINLAAIIDRVAGGVLVTESRFGAKNENAALHENPMLKEFLDITSDHIETIDDRITIPKLRSFAYGFRDLISTSDDCLMEYQDGYPAFIEKKIGNGKILYATFSLFMSIGKTGNERLADYVRSYLPKPKYFLKDKNNMEMVLWESDTNPILYVINHSAQKEKFEIDTPSNFSKALDLISDKEFEIEKGKLPLSVEGRTVLVLKLS